MPDGLTLCDENKVDKVLRRGIQSNAACRRRCPALAPTIKRQLYKVIVEDEKLTIDRVFHEALSLIDVLCEHDADLDRSISYQIKEGIYESDIQRLVVWTDVCPLEFGVLPVALCVD